MTGITRMLHDLGKQGKPQWLKSGFARSQDGNYRAAWFPSLDQRQLCVGQLGERAVPLDMQLARQQ